MSVNLRVKIEIGSLVKLRSNFFGNKGFLVDFCGFIKLKPYT